MVNDGPSGLVSGGSGITEPFFSNYEEIGRGEYHILYRARRYGRWYVLKGLREELRGNAFYEEWLYKEYSIGVSLDYPNIVRVESLEEDPVAVRCIVMEWVEGTTLGECNKRQAKQKRDLLRQLFDAVEYCHYHGIYHHDLKPSNILVTTDGRVKTIDFGLSDGPQYAAFKQSGGSDGFAAPEQRNGALADQRADIYALGRLVRTLFPCRYRRASRQALRTDPARRPSSVAELRRLMRFRIPWYAMVLALLLLLLVWLAIPSGRLYSTVLPSGQTVWLREVQRFPHREVAVTRPGEGLVSYPEGFAMPAGDMVLPSTVRLHGLEWDVVEVDDFAFRYDYQLTSVRFPSTLRRIGEAAFLGCVGLEDTLIIPKGLKRLGDNAFGDCARLTVLLWKAVDCEGEKADGHERSYFSRCNMLCEVYVEDGVRRLSVMLFIDMVGLEQLYVGEGIEMAPNDLAASCEALKYLSLPATMIYIDHGAFYKTALDTLVLPDSVEVVGDYSFAYCRHLRSITFGRGVTRVGNYSFTECEALKEVVVLPTTPPDIQYTAFNEKPENVVLRVPAEAVEAYRRHPVWGTFGCIESYRL